MKIVAFPFTDLLETPIGHVQIKATADAIHQVNFADDPAIVSLRSSPLTEICKQQLQEYFNGTRTVFDLPLNQQGTIFQQAVWELITHTPYGNTISYLQLAVQAGDEKTIRAVANANGKNSLAIIVPCHRVIGSDGSLTGYAWGLKRKQWLLDFEARNSGKKLTLF